MTAPSAPSVPGGGPAASSAEPDRRRWLILALIGLAQLMIVLDMTIMNIALPSAQHALGFSNVDRQWVITAYALTFGSLLLFGGRLGDLFGRKLTLHHRPGRLRRRVGGGRGRGQLRHAGHGPGLPGGVRARCWPRPPCPS